MSDPHRSEGERGPAVAGAQQAKVAILKAADAIRRRAATLLAGRDITFRQYNVLRILRGARSAPITSAQLAERTIEVISDLPALLDDLARKGLARAERSGDDAPRWTVTDAGMDLLTQLDAPVAQADLTAVQDLDEADVRVLVGLLDRVRARA